MANVRPLARADAEIEWILNERLTGEQNGASVMVRAADGRTCALSLYDSGALTFDGRLVDVGDDFPCFLGIMDEIAEYGVSEPEHDCPKDRFLADPITQAYGVGAEMVDQIPCPVCDARTRNQ